MHLEIFPFWWFYGSKKSFLTTKLLIKREIQKIKKIPHTILDKIFSQIISQNFYKIGLNPKELELLEKALVITFFFKKFVGEGFVSFLTYYVIHVNNVY